MFGEGWGRGSTPTSWDAINGLQGRDRSFSLSKISTLRVATQFFHPRASVLCSESFGHQKHKTISWRSVSPQEQECYEFFPSEYGLKLEWDCSEMEIRSEGKQGQVRKEIKSVLTPLSYWEEGPGQAGPSTREFSPKLRSSLFPESESRLMRPSAGIVIPPWFSSFPQYNETETYAQSHSHLQHQAQYLECEMCWKIINLVYYPLPSQAISS